MIVEPKFYYEGQLPHLGDKAYFVVTYLPGRIFSKVFPEELRLSAGLHWAQMTNLFVAPKYRRQGYGSQLLTLLKDWQDVTETNLIFLASPYRKRSGCSRQALHDFYSQNGFPQVKETAYHARTWAEKPQIGPNTDKNSDIRYNFQRFPVFQHRELNIFT